MRILLPRSDRQLSGPGPMARLSPRIGSCTRRFSMQIVKAAVRSGVGWSALAIAAVLVASLSAQEPAAQPARQTPKLTFSGDVALWTVAIKPDKTADFERIMARVSEALSKSADPTRQKQAAGGKVMKIDKPLPDGNIAYVHVISPVVPDADYTVMQILYDAFPEERQALYDSYRDAFAANLSLASGPVAVDLAPASATSATTATSATSS